MLEDFVNKSNLIHNNFYDYSLVDYKNNNIKVKIICPIHGTFEQIPKNHTKGQGCPKCATIYKAKKLTKNIDDFLNQVNITHNNFFSYDKINYINNKTDIVVTCPIHGDFTVNPSHHLNGTGCSKCSKTYRKSTEDFINKAKIVHSDRYDYSLTIFKNNKTKIKIICPKHGEFEQRPEHHLLGCNCPKCNSSKGEIEIRKYLKIYDIKFIEQKRFNECRNKKPLPFDFYLPNYNICIEYDGIQHYIPIRGDKFLQIVIKHDNIKNEFCKNKNIELIRIPYTENNIESIIKTIKNK
jgi:Zn finger protein HypA/HybF involved in hydrogenase expression